MMKKALIIAIFALHAISANAQAGMPKELTCTEEAFNFSVSLGTKWKFGTPKMGPVEITRNEPGYLPAWSLKVSDISHQTYSQALFYRAQRPDGLGYAINPPNNVPLSDYERLKFMKKLGFINYNLPINSTALKANLLLNSNQQFVY